MSNLLVLYTFFEEWCLGCSVVKICLPKQEMQAQSLGREDPLE